MLTHCTSGCLGAAWHLLPQPPGHLWTGDESGRTQTPPPGVVGAMQGPALSCPCSGTHTATSLCLSGLRALKETLVPPLPSSLQPTSGRASTPPNLGLPLLLDLQVPTFPPAVLLAMPSAGYQAPPLHQSQADRLRVPHWTPGLAPTQPHLSSLGGQGQRVTHQHLGSGEELRTPGQGFGRVSGHRLQLRYRWAGALDALDTRGHKACVWPKAGLSADSMTQHSWGGSFQVPS